jgi:Integrase core domain
VFGTLSPSGLSQASGESATGSQQTTFNAMTQFMNVLTDAFVAGRGDGFGPSGGAPTGYASPQNAGVPTISFRLFYGLLIVGHRRRQIFWFGVTAHPTADWIANQITEACGWEQAPRYLIRDRDGAYGEVFIRRLRSMGIRDRPTSPRSPWQNGYAERLIGSIRRECLAT